MGENMSGNLTEYKNHRNKIRDCDIIMYRGEGISSSLINWATGSSYTHAGITVWWNERLMIMEAASTGVVISPLSRNLEKYKGRADWYSCNLEITEEKRKEMTVFAQAELGKEYAMFEAILFGLYLKFKKNLDVSDILEKKKKLFCSQYVAQIYNSTGHDLKKNRNDMFMSPDDIASSPLLKMKATLKRK